MLTCCRYAEFLLLSPTLSGPIVDKGTGLKIFWIIYETNLQIPFSCIWAAPFSGEILEPQVWQTHARVIKSNILQKEKVYITSYILPPRGSIDSCQHALFAAYLSTRIKKPFDSPLKTLTK